MLLIEGRLFLNFFRDLFDHQALSHDLGSVLKKSLFNSRDPEVPVLGDLGVILDVHDGRYGGPHSRHYHRRGIVHGDCEETAESGSEVYFPLNALS